MTFVLVLNIAQEKTCDAMDTVLLTHEELDALHALTRGRVRHRISSDVGAKLLSLGLVREAADGYVITHRGRDSLNAQARRKPAPGAARASYSTFAPES